MKCVGTQLISACDVTGHQPVAVRLVRNCVVCKYWCLQRIVISFSHGTRFCPDQGKSSIL